MKVTVENKKGLNKDLKIFIDKKTMNSYLDEKYEEIKGTVNLKGFRPGKVPREILKRQFGQAVFSEVLDKVVDIVCSQLTVSKDDVTSESSFVEDLGADSLDTVELVMAFEEEFGLEIPDDEAENITTIQSAVDWIENNS